MKKLIVLLLVGCLASLAQAGIVADYTFDTIPSYYLGGFNGYYMKDDSGNGYTSNAGGLAGAGLLQDTTSAPSGTVSIPIGYNSNNYAQQNSFFAGPIGFGTASPDFTLEMVTEFTNDGTRGVLFTTPGDYGSLVQLADNTMEWQPGAGSSSMATTAVAAGWHNVTITVDAAGENTLFIDGVVRASTTLAGATAHVSDLNVNLMWGNWAWGRTAADGWNGLLDHVRFSDTVLIPGEMLPVPEPMTLCLLGLGGLMLRRRKS